jgi:formiminoglutamase
MQERLSVLISVPHGGTLIPAEIRDRVCLDCKALSYYSDPATQYLYDMRGLATAFMQSDVSRVVIDLNRPPYHLPPKYPDGVVKTRSSLGQPVWREGFLPDLACIHRLLLRHYFPYHAEVDRLLLSGNISVALDCHSMVPVGLPGQPDEGKKRPLFCLSNNGDGEGEARPGALPTCPAEWIQALRDAIREHFTGKGTVLINHPFHGGFIMNAHFWHTGVPWVQIEMNRSLYEADGSSSEKGSLTDQEKVKELNRVFCEIICEWVRKIGQV